MHSAFAAVALPLVSTLGIIFVLLMVARDQEARPISLPMAGLCGAIVIILVIGVHDAPVETPWGWPAAIALCLGFLACGVWDQRAYLFGAAAPDRGHVASSGRSLAGLALIALTEELLFRGLMQSSLLTALSGPGGTVTALFMVNLAFAAMHANHGLTFALSAGFFGMILSMTVILSGSVWPAALTHMAWNLIIGIARRRAAL
ncbi:MAG: CPBP family intramembrane metalloprotease [Pseudomonadota bacterium]|nr:CPBP family intramembrane metalloprotease [Pseudomonadota bacterium]